MAIATDTSQSREQTLGISTLLHRASMFGVLLSSAPLAADHVIDGLPFEGGELELAALGHFILDDRAHERSAFEASIGAALSDRTALSFGIGGERPAGGSIDVESLKIAGIARLAPKTDSPWSWGTLIGYSRGLNAGGADEVELGIIIERSTAEWSLATNLKASRELTDSADGDWEAAAHVTRSIRTSVDLGLEAFDAPADYSARSRQIGPCFHISWPWGRQTVQISVAGLLRASGTAPDTTVRLVVAVLN